MRRAHIYGVGGLVRRGSSSSTMMRSSASRGVGEAKAYPITVMGVHELGNDTIGGMPIAVTW